MNNRFEVGDKIRLDSPERSSLIEEYITAGYVSKGRVYEVRANKGNGPFIQIVNNKGFGWWVDPIAFTNLSRARLKRNLPDWW